MGGTRTREKLKGDARSDKQVKLTDGVPLSVTIEHTNRKTLLLDFGGPPMKTSNRLFKFFQGPLDIQAPARLLRGFTGTCSLSAHLPTPTI